MTLRKKILAALLLLVVLSGVAWQIFRLLTPDPIYKGKPLSYWLSGKKISQDKANEAVREAGIQAIPLLLRMIRVNDSPFKRRWIALSRDYGFVWCPLIPADVCHSQAEEGFKTLGSMGSNAVPELMRIYESNPSENTKLFVIMSLRDIGAVAQESVPLLLRARTNTDYAMRVYVVQALARMRFQVETIVPALMSSLDDPEPYVRVQAVRSLGELGPQATAAIPRLLDLYKNVPPDAKVIVDEPVTTRELIERALKKIDPAAAANAGIQTANGGPTK
jgi:HEAT repeat protein